MDRFEFFRFFSRFQFLSRKFTSPRWWGKHFLPTYWMIRYEPLHSLCHMKIPQEIFILWIRVGVCRSTRPITNSVGFPDTEGEFPVEGEGREKVCLSKSFYSIFRMNEWSGFYSVRIITSLSNFHDDGGAWKDKDNCLPGLISAHLARGSRY